MIIFVHICFSETPKKDFLRPSTPSAPVLSDETKPLKRVAMSAKPENQKPAVLVPSGGNVRTPQNTVPTRRSSRLFGSTQVNFGKFHFLFFFIKAVYYLENFFSNSFSPQFLLVLFPERMRY